MIEKRGNKWWYRFQHQGKDIRRSTGLAATSENRKPAQQIEAKAKLEAQAGTAPSPGSSVSFDTAARHFLTWCRDVEYRHKASTAARLATSFASIVAHFGSLPVHLVGVAAVEDYKAHRLTVQMVQDITVRHDLHALSVFFKRYAVPRGYAPANPVDQVRKPSDANAQREHVLTAEEEAAYFAIAKRNQALYDLGRLMIQQGCRPEEILSARVEHFDRKGKTLLIAGGKSRAARRVLPLTAESFAILATRARGKAEGWLFPSPRADRRGEHQTKLNCAHDRACRDSGTAFVLYDLRHTFATRYAAIDPNPYTLAKIMGWASIAMAKRYIHVEAATVAAGMKAFETAGAEFRTKKTRKAS
jgi:integrase